MEEEEEFFQPSYQVFPQFTWLNKPCELGKQRPKRISGWYGHSTVKVVFFFFLSFIDHKASSPVAVKGCRAWSVGAGGKGGLHCPAHLLSMLYLGHVRRMTVMLMIHLLFGAATQHPDDSSDVWWSV